MAFAIALRSDHGMTRAEQGEPTWRLSDVADLLSDFSAERLPVTYKRNSDGSLTALSGYQFECGCTAQSIEGWTSCRRSVHWLLSQAAPGSRHVSDFRRLRSLFKLILREAWRRRGRNDSEFAQYIALRYRRSIDEWQATHDLLDQPIVQQDGSLYADLAALPAQQRIALYNGGNLANVHFVLQLTGDDMMYDVGAFDDVREMAAPLDLARYTPEEIIAVVFGAHA